MNEKQDDLDITPTGEKRPKRISLRPVTIILFLTVNLIVLMILAWPYLQARYQLPYDLPWDFGQPFPTPEITELESKVPTNLPISENKPGIAVTASATVTPEVTISSFGGTSSLWDDGSIVLSIQEGLDTHLFVYQPFEQASGISLPFKHLTKGSWEDITPAISPNKTQMAFASNRSGYWDIHILDLENGKTTLFTDTQEYDASPSWSPDGLWLVYESYIEDNLEILIHTINSNDEPIRLTTHFAADFSPVWSPLGRQIAFVSTRGGKSQIWLANLDESGSDRFVVLSQHYETSAANPVWSPDGRYLAWAAVTTDGLHNIYVWDSSKPENQPIAHGSGDWAVWSPDGQALLVVVKTPYQSYLTAYRFDHVGSIILPPVALPGPVSGIAWSDMIHDDSTIEINQATPTPLWVIDIQTRSDETNGRWNLIPLEDVEAPYPRLHDLVDESYLALRGELASQVGWDLLGNLENAFLPFTAALSPGLVEDWTYTGRAFSVNTLPIKAGWMAVFREDFGLQTFWRIYLRTRFQDGSQGRPLHDLPWDFNARYSGRPAPYDQGGELSTLVPRGYWLDMTSLVSMYGWQRLSALSNWRAAYSATRFNEFVKTDGLDWVSAMLEIYPNEVLLTLTPAPTATASFTPAPLWYKTPTDTPTLTKTPLVSATINATPTTSVTPTETNPSQSSPTATKTPSP